MKILTLLFFCLLAHVAGPIPSYANDSLDKLLPTPRTEGGMPLMQALRERQSSRSFSDQELPDQVLSDLLWAAFGINRPDSGRRTAPSARNWQEVDVYVVMKDASYVYEPESHSLNFVAKGDFRSLTGRQDFAATAPLNLVFVADISRMTGVSADGIDLYIGADVGFVSQNVYLFCASEGLATVVRASLDQATLGKALNLTENQRIVLAQTIGYHAGYVP